MSEAEHARALRAAGAVDGELRRIFAMLGSAEHPNGQVLRAYRVARRSLRASGGLRPGAVAETVAELRNTMQRVATDALTLASTAGATSARKQLEAYGLRPRPMMYDTGPALQAWLAIVDSQAASVRAAVATGAAAELISGDDTQPGLLNPSPAVREGTKWAAVVLTAAWWAWISSVIGGIAGRLTDRGARGRGPDEFLKQAIAAIDERTTECCLKAHGQTQPMDTDFRLTGRPRYADRLPWTPFHWYCRSSVALVRRRDAEDSLTQQMIDAARAELRARADGSRVEIHPADARSRR